MAKLKLTKVETKCWNCSTIMAVKYYTKKVEFVEDLRLCKRCRNLMLLDIRLEKHNLDHKKLLAIIALIYSLQ